MTAVMRLALAPRHVEARMKSSMHASFTCPLPPARIRKVLVEEIIADSWGVKQRIVIEQ